MHSKEVPLKIEEFSHNDGSDFIIHGHREILSILHDIAAHRSRVALYYNDDNSMVLTLVLAVDEKGLWIDAAADPRENKQIERSQRIVFVSIHNQAKVQWVSTETTLGIYENATAFFVPLPRKLLRLQRRDYYRLLTRESNALKCVIRPLPDQEHVLHEVTVMDISIGGMALVCEENGVALQPGLTYRNCVIELPDFGTINADIEVRNSIEVTMRNGEVKRRAGCIFVNTDRSTHIILQRYVARMQREQASSRFEEE